MSSLYKNIFLLLSIHRVSTQLPTPRRCLLVRERLVPPLRELRNRLLPVPAGPAYYPAGTCSPFSVLLLTLGQAEGFLWSTVSADCLTCLKMSLQNLLDGAICFSVILLHYLWQWLTGEKQWIYSSGWESIAFLIPLPELLGALTVQPGVPSNTSLELLGCRVSILGHFYFAPCKTQWRMYAKELSLQSLLLIKLGKGELHCDRPSFSFVFKKEPFKGHLDLTHI